MQYTACSAIRVFRHRRSDCNLLTAELQYLESARVYATRSRLVRCIFKVVHYEQMYTKAVIRRRIVLHFRDCSARFCIWTGFEVGSTSNLINFVCIYFRSSYCSERCYLV